MSFFSSIASAKMSVPRANAMKQMVQYSWANNGISSDTGIGKEKWTIINSTAAAPSFFNTGNQQTVTFDLPGFGKGGKLVDGIVELVCALSATGAGNLSLLPTSLWIDRLEVLVDNQVVETVDKDDVYNENVLFQTEQSYQTLNVSQNYSATTNGFGPLTAVTSTPVSQTFHLPIWATSLMSAQPCLKYIKNQVSVRFTFSANIVNLALTTSTTNTVAVSALRLYADFVELPPSLDADVSQSHVSGCYYNTIVRNKYKSSTISTIPSASETSFTLTNLTKATAGIVVYVRPDSTVVANQLTRSNLAVVKLVDESNNDLTPTLPGSLISLYVNTQSVPIGSTITKSSGFVYVFPFVNSLQSAIEEGDRKGGMWLQGKNQVVIRPVADATGSSVSVLSYEFARWTVRENYLTVEYA